MNRVLLLAALGLAAAAPAQQKATHEGAEAIVLSNDRIELLVAPLGGAFLSFTLKEDPKRINTMWDPVRMGRETRGRSTFGPSKGHFLCVDGFGPVSREEAAAGMTGHGEANKLPWDIVSSDAMSATFRVKLPKAQETLTRSHRIAPGEQVVLVESELESHTAFDRPMLWAEHATIGAPFLAIGKTIVDASSTECRTKPHQDKGPRTFPSGKDFRWPSLTLDGTPIDMRVTPAEHGVMNHIGCLMDPARELQFVTAYNSAERLMIGYVFPYADYPWIQHWMNYPASGTYAWGLEFGMQPYDMTKQEILDLTPMFGKPTFRWLPAQSKVKTRFLMFVTRVPAGFEHTSGVRLGNGQLIVEDGTSGKSIQLRYQGTLR